jgi:UDP-N-acetylglucosamine--N-acetylmuramyl-(pentapeptide) pyrophosphoryl-undecaprenol N-acetylglucosamine transferase
MKKVSSNPRLLIAASGTGGHLFPAIATAEQLPDYQIEWLGVPDRLETQLVPAQYPLHRIQVEGFQKRLGLGTFRILWHFVQAIFKVRRLLKQGQFQGVFTTGGYIAAPAIIAARTLGLPALIHESNAIPGKVTRWLAPWCTVVAVGFEQTAQFLPRDRTAWVGTPVRSEFRHFTTLKDFNIPTNAPLIAVVGGSQGAVALNRFVRQCAPVWLEAGAWIIHQTGSSDPDAQGLSHPHYVALPFYENMAALLKRANLAISRAGAGTLTELAVAQTPAILVPFPFAAEDHQTYNAKVFVDAGAALMFPQAELTAKVLESEVLLLLQNPQRLYQMAQQMALLAIADSAERMAALIQESTKLIERQ